MYCLYHLYLDKGCRQILTGGEAEQHDETEPHELCQISEDDLDRREPRHKQAKLKTCF